MTRGIVAHAATAIKAPIERVWDALTNPAKITQYMFGTQVTSQFREGSAITWKGEWQGKPYEDKGRIVRVQPKRLLQYTHFSPMSGQPDLPENYHTVTIELSTEGPMTRVSLAQDGNETDEVREHSEQNWRMMLDGLKKMLEGA